MLENKKTHNQKKSVDFLPTLSKFGFSENHIQTSSSELAYFTINLEVVLLLRQFW